MAEKIPDQNLEAEIKHLEAELEQKKKEMAETGQEFRPAEEAAKVVKEYTKAPPQMQAAKPQDDSALQKAAARLQNEPHAKQVEELLNIAQKSGILNAVSIARKLHNPHLLDDFHDRLVFELLKEKK